MPSRTRKDVVAIDGPAGAGKSTVAKGVARALGFAYLDTGAMYRAVTARALAEGIDPSDAKMLARLTRAMEITFSPAGMEVDGSPVGREIRTRRVSRWASTVSAHADVRRELVRRQRKILEMGRVVAEGRDIGTVVCPDAPLKIFLTASIDERAKRRHKEMAHAGDSVPFTTLKREIARRDALDSTRPVSPLIPASDAIVLDTTGKGPRQVISEIVELAKAAGIDGRGAASPGGRTRNKS